LIWHAKNSGKRQNYLGLEIRQKVLIGFKVSACLVSGLDFFFLFFFECISGRGALPFSLRDKREFKTVLETKQWEPQAVPPKSDTSHSLHPHNTEHRK
jgi:hypothetical protein